MEFEFVHNKNDDYDAWEKWDRNQNRLRTLVAILELEPEKPGWDGSDGVTASVEGCNCLAGGPEEEEQRDLW